MVKFYTTYIDTKGLRHYTIATYNASTNTIFIPIKDIF